MRWLLLLLTLLSFRVQARVELQSVYFIGTSTELTDYSEFILNRLRSSFKNGDYQIIEINAFCDNAVSNSDCRIIAQRRLELVLRQLDSDSTNVTMHVYGNQKIEVNFEPVHWNRVDVYYAVNESWREQESPLVSHQNMLSEEVDTASILIHTPRVDSSISPNIPFMKIPAYMRIPFGEPVPLPLYFDGNKVIMKDPSAPVLDQLYRTLITYPNVTIHIRGHVCCGKNKRISKKRAHYVYTYLVRRGIDKERLSYKGYSNKEPVVFPERTDEDRSKNRRVDIIYSEH